MKELKEVCCDICGVYFQQTNSKQKYCPECRQHSRMKRQRLEQHIHASAMRYIDRNPKPDERMNVKCICKVCNKEFLSYSPTSTYCSDYCKNRFIADNKYCAVCGKRMSDVRTVPRRGRLHTGSIWYCSKECRDIGQWINARDKNRVAVCPTCGKEFLPKGSPFCSDLCRKNYKGDKSAIREETKKKYYKRYCQGCGKEVIMDTDKGLCFCSPECEEKIRKILG